MHPGAGFLARRKHSRRIAAALATDLLHADARLAPHGIGHDKGNTPCVIWVMASIHDDTALIVRGVLRLGRRLRAERPSSSVSLSALGMLSSLHRIGPMPAARLAQAERLQPQSLSRLIAQLERDGLIQRRQGSEDRRTLILEITAAGRQVLARDMAARRAWLEGAMRRVLIPGEREMLAHAAVAMLRLADEGADTAEDRDAEE